MNSTSLLPAALRRPKPNRTPKLLLDRIQAAAALGICPRLLDQLTASVSRPNAPLMPLRVGRRVLFTPAELQRWIDAETKATP